MTTERKCPICWKPLVHRPGEVPSKFNGRMFCSKGCATAARGARYDSLLRDGKAPAPTPKADPQKPGPKPAPKPACLACGKPTATPTAKYCSVLCANRHKPRSGAQISQTPPAPPKPRMATQKLCGPKPEPTGLTVIKKKPTDYPMVDPGLCGFVGRTVWASDGAAIVADLHAHRPICASLVRGWASTTAPGTDGYRTPWFETEAGAALWDAICEHRLGRSESRAA